MNKQKDNRKRRRCRNCKKRVNLYIFKKKIKGKLLTYCRCPNCLSEARFFIRKKKNKDL